MVMSLGLRMSFFQHCHPDRSEGSILKIATVLLTKDSSPMAENDNKTLDRDPNEQPWTTSTSKGRIVN